MEAVFSINEFLKENKNWIIIAILIFVAGAALCCLPLAAGESASLDQLIGAQLEDLEHIIKTLQDMPPPVLVLLIFINNLISMGQMLLLGFLAGLSPLFTLFVNGVIIGNITSAISQEGYSIWPFLCLGILPHGIFELSAFFICGALGLKFGYHCVASPLPGLSRKQSFFYIWREVISIMPLILILLAIAAVMEIYISQALLFKYLKI